MFHTGAALVADDLYITMACMVMVNICMTCTGAALVADEYSSYFFPQLFNDNRSLLEVPARLKAGAVLVHPSELTGPFLF